MSLDPPDPPGLDLRRLRAHLDEAAPGLLAPRGELVAEVIPGGKSNLTYLLQDGSRRWVLRRPPLGHVLASAHDMGREYRVLTALAGTDVPVPQTVIHCATPEVIGAPFYVMEFVDGAVLSQAELGGGRAASIACSLVDVLARLHAVDPAEVGLADFSRPTGYLERHLQRWTRQLKASASRPLPAAADLQVALAADIPHTAKTCLLHGDYRLENVLIGKDEQVRAVLDWEMSALGDPLADLALFLLYHAAPDVITSATNLAPLLARYTRHHPADLSRLDWYIGLAYFKLAAICEGIHFRYINGQTVGPGFENVGTTVEPLLEAGISACERDSTARVGRAGLS